MTSPESGRGPEVANEASEKLATDILLAAAELVWQRHSGNLTVESAIPKHNTVLQFTSTPLEVATHYRLSINVVSGNEAAAELLDLVPGLAELVVDIDKSKGWRITEARHLDEKVRHQVTNWQELLAKPKAGEIASRFPFDVGQAVSAQTYFRQIA